MLTTKQFISLLAVAILSAAFTALTVIGIFSQDFDFAVGAMVMLVVVIAASSYFVIQDSEPEHEGKRRIGNIYIAGLRATTGAFIAKYAAAGTVTWQRALSITTSCVLYGIAVSPDNTYIYACGTQTVSSITSIIVVKVLASTGVITWQRTIGQASLSSDGSSIALDAAENVYVSGYTTGTNSSRFLFIAKLPPDGSLTATYSVGGYSMTYAAGALTQAAGSMTAATPAYTSSTTTFTDAAATTTTASNTTLTSYVTTIA